MHPSLIQDSIPYAKEYSEVAAVFQEHQEAHLTENCDHSSDCNSAPMHLPDQTIDPSSSDFVESGMATSRALDGMANKGDDQSSGDSTVSDESSEEQDTDDLYTFKFIDGASKPTR